MRKAHWLTLLEYADEADEIVLVSGDRGAFAAVGHGSGLHPQLLHDLRQEAAQCTVTLVESIAGVTVPGIFLPDELDLADLDLDLEAALLDELNRTVLPKLDLQPDDLGLVDVDAVTPVRFQQLRLTDHHIRQHYVQNTSTDIRADATADLVFTASTLLPQRDQEDDLVEETRSALMELSVETSSSTSELGPVTLTRLQPTTTTPPSYALQIPAETLQVLSRLHDQVRLSPSVLRSMQAIADSWSVIHGPGCRVCECSR